MPSQHSDLEEVWEDEQLSLERAIEALGVLGNTWQRLGRRTGVNHCILGWKGSTSYESEDEIWEELVSLTMTGEIGM